MNSPAPFAISEILILLIHSAMLLASTPAALTPSKRERASSENFSLMADLMSKMDSRPSPMRSICSCNPLVFSVADSIPSSQLINRGIIFFPISPRTLLIWNMAFADPVLSLILLSAPAIFSSCMAGSSSASDLISLGLNPKAESPCAGVEFGSAAASPSRSDTSLIKSTASSGSSPVVLAIASRNAK